MKKHTESKEEEEVEVDPENTDIAEITIEEANIVTAAEVEAELEVEIELEVEVMIDIIIAGKIPI